ncbi:hypothetical protein PR003_g18779 [Phytophthora rubi]|uniref:Uncharacterized protein n=1 Tax=Phytophthora rubi TaxID=129364 RepID=A0A6A4E152_9STRA|nr:hypothetical protein PR003_g18779 [Phytophthora rubi]
MEQPTEQSEDKETAKAKLLSSRLFWSNQPEHKQTEATAERHRRGPVLLMQDMDEAKTNVNKRLEFINNELSKVNTKIEAKQKAAIGIQTNIPNKQMEIQKRAAEAAKGAVAAH